MISVALIGLGWWGKTMARLLGSSSRLKLVRVVDIDPAGAELARQMRSEEHTSELQSH